MYHYYVRYSIYNDGNRLGAGSIELIFEKEISQISDIVGAQEIISEKVNEKANVTAEDILIDFYTILRKDPD